MHKIKPGAAELVDIRPGHVERPRCNTHDSPRRPRYSAPPDPYWRNAQEPEARVSGRGASHGGDRRACARAPGASLRLPYRSSRNMARNLVSSAPSGKDMLAPARSALHRRPILEPVAGAPPARLLLLLPLQLQLLLFLAVCSARHIAPSRSRSCAGMVVSYLTLSWRCFVDHDDLSSFRRGTAYCRPRQLSMNRWREKTKRGPRKMRPVSSFLVSFASIVGIAGAFFVPAPAPGEFYSGLIVT